MKLVMSGSRFEKGVPTVCSGVSAQSCVPLDCTKHALVKSQLSGISQLYTQIWWQQVDDERKEKKWHRTLGLALCTPPKVQELGRALAFFVLRFGVSLNHGAL